MAVGILLAIPCGCQIANTNGLKDARESYVLAERVGQLRRLRRELLETEENIRKVRADIDASEKQLRAENLRILPISTALGERLRSLHVMEEDLKTARKTHADVQSDLEALRQAAADVSRVKTTLDAAEKSLVTGRAALAKKQAEIQRLATQVAELTALEGRLRGVLDEVRAKVPTPVTQPGKRKAGEKK